MASNVTPPPLQGPTAKEKRYDRQLRLWAANGQQALEEAHILLLNGGSGAVGAETLKNLVLPGVGAFTIVDDAIVQEDDLGVNFFLEPDSLGRSRAIETVRLLRELNPEVQGIAISQAADLWLANSDISRYSLIIVVGPTSFTKVLGKVSSTAWKHSIPVFFVRSVGFYSTVSIQLPSRYPIVETHPDPTSTQDLRLLAPWKELLEIASARTNELESMTDHDHGHVPYLLLLLHFLDLWHKKHGSYPTTYKDKTAFREEVRGEARTSNPEQGEENFDEAAAAVLKALNPPAIPSGLRDMFSDPECEHPTSASAHFWVVAHALKGFVEKNGVLPLPGAIPDMKAQSSDYLALQNVYRAKAQADLAAVTVAVRKLETDLNRAPVDSKEIEAFCKGAAFVKLVHGWQITAPYAPSEKQGETVGGAWNGRDAMVIRELGDSESLISILVGLIALDAVVDAGDTEIIEDSQALQNALEQHTRRILGSLQSSDANFSIEDLMKSTDDTRQEVARAGPFELHNISSLTGGIAAQEVIKAITKQYIPADNTIVFDGITSRTSTFRL